MQSGGLYRGLAAMDLPAVPQFPVLSYILFHDNQQVEATGSDSFQGVLWIIWITNDQKVKVKDAAPQLIKKRIFLGFGIHICSTDATKYLF